MKRIFVSVIFLLTLVPSLQAMPRRRERITSTESGGIIRVLLNEYDASTCEEDDINDAIEMTMAVDDTVNVPAGNCTWTTGVSFASGGIPRSIHVRGAGSYVGSCSTGFITGGCGSANQTVIYINGGSIGSVGGDTSNPVLSNF